MVHGDKPVLILASALQVDSPLMNMCLLSFLTIKKDSYVLRIGPQIVQASSQVRLSDIYGKLLDGSTATIRFFFCFWGEKHRK